MLGRYTRLAQFYGDTIKGYEGEIRFGFATDTYDADGEPITAACKTEGITLQAILEVSGRFVGKLLQTPPPYSAKKIKGVPATFVFDRDGLRAKKFTNDDPDNQYDMTDVEKLVIELLRPRK